MNRPRTTLPYTDRHKERGADYDVTFLPEVNPYRAMLWRLEQEALDDILPQHSRRGPIDHLDFACGTGRILAHCLRYTTSSTGVDVSASMLDLARKAAPNAELIEADVTQENALGDRRFDLITAFRFFPNAEPPLRRSVMAVLAQHLSPAGRLIFNNHKNKNSLRRRISRLLDREIARGLMTHDEVERLVADAGLRILEMIPLGTVPVSERHLLLPIRILEPMERRLRNLAICRPIAENVIYVCARAD